MNSGDKLCCVAVSQGVRCSYRGSAWRDDRRVCGLHARARIVRWFDTDRIVRTPPRGAICEVRRDGWRCSKPAVLVTQDRLVCSWHC